MLTRTTLLHGCKPGILTRRRTSRQSTLPLSHSWNVAEPRSNYWHINTVSAPRVGQQRVVATAAGIWALAAPKDMQDHIFKSYGAKTKRIAMGCNTMIGLEEGGGTWFWSGLPEGLHSTLWGRQAELPGVEYVALDASDSDHYYVRFTDGKSEWNAPASFCEAVHDRSGSSHPKIVCFAPNNGWYILWDDGTSNWERLPEDLHDRLNNPKKSLPGVKSKKRLPGVKAMSCGPYGEWFVGYSNGSWWVNSPSDALDHTLDNIDANKKKVLAIELGRDNSYVVFYS